MKTRSLVEGWRLLLLTSLLLLAAAAIAFLAHAQPADGIRQVIRLTARTSLLLFLAAFVASAAVTLWPGRLSHWLRRNRRQLGLSFAVSHLIHAAAIVALAAADPLLFDQLTNAATIAGGGLAYLFILALAATSSDRAVAWLGPRRWQRLHSIGLWAIWVTFIVTFGKRVPADPVYGVAILLLFGALAIRIAARRARRQGPIARSTAAEQPSG